MGLSPRGRVQGLWHWEHSPAREMPGALQTPVRDCPGDMFPSQETHDRKGRLAGRLEPAASQRHTGGRGGPGARIPAPRLSVIVTVTIAPQATCSGVSGCCLSCKQNMNGFLPAWAQDVRGRGRGRGQPWPLRRPQAGGSWKDVAPGPPPPPASWAGAAQPARSRRAFMESGAACAASDAVESSNHQEFDQGPGSPLCRHMEPS